MADNEHVETEEPIDIRVWDIPEEEDGYVSPSALQKYMRKTPWWATSVAFHGLIILCLYLIQWGVMSDKGKDIPMVTEIARQEEKLEEKDEKIFKEEKLERDTVEKDLPEVDDVVVNRVFEEKVANTEAVGDPDMLSDVDLGGDGHVGTMGIGGGGMAGMFGSRGGGKKRAIAKYGGKGTLTAVDRGLEWLKRHQCPDGGWGPQDYADQCKGANTKCKEGVGTMSNMSAHGTAKLGLTGLGVLCFLGAGYTHKSGKYKQVVEKALGFILAGQQPGGYFGAEKGGYPGPEYGHGICALALAEAYGMTKDRKLKKPLERTVKYLLKAQHPGGAWGYPLRNMVNDTTVSAYIIMALKDAKLSGIKADYSKAFKGFHRHLENVCIGKHKGIGAYRKGWHTGGGVGPHSATGIAMMCRMFLGAKRDDPAIKEGIKYLSDEGTKWKTSGLIPGDEGIYYVYYTSLGMFQHGGKEWKKWNKQMKPELLKAQIKGGCADGSWPVANAREIPGFKNWHERLAGKVYATTLTILTLEVYYRYSPLFR